MVVDTPGVFDTEESNDTIQDEICKCIAITSPGPHAFILVLNIASRYTIEEQRSVEHFFNFFGENIYKYLIVLFVRKDELDAENISLLEHLRNSPPNLQILLKKCGGRFCAFNNKLTGRKQEEQVLRLLKVVMENVEKHGGKCYTNEMYIEAENLLKQRENEILRKEEEKKEKELQALKMLVTEDFTKQCEQNMIKIQFLENDLTETKQKQKETEREKDSLNMQLKENEQKLNAYIGKEQEQLRQQIEMLKNQIKKNAEEASKEEQKRQEIENEKQKYANEKDILQSHYENKIRKLQSHYEVQLEKERQTTRMQVREEIIKENEVMEEEKKETKRDTIEMKMKDMITEIKAIRENVEAEREQFQSMSDKMKKENEILKQKISQLNRSLCILS